MPQRIMRRRYKGWQMPAGAVFVGRSTKWENPESALNSSRAEHKCALRWFETHLRERRVPGSGAEFIDGYVRYPSDAEIRRELAGRDLACWCPIGFPCHADLLIKLANSPRVVTVHLPEGDA